MKFTHLNFIDSSFLIIHLFLTIDFWTLTICFYKNIVCFVYYSGLHGQNAVLTVDEGWLSDSPNVQSNHLSLK